MTNVDPNLIVMVAAGAGLLLLVVGLLIGRLSPSVVEERLGRYSESGGQYGPTTGEQTRERPTPLTDFFDQLGEGTNLFGALSKHLARADLKFRPAEYVFLIINSGFVMGFIGYILAGQVGFGILTGIFGLFLPPLYVLRSQKKRLSMFDHQLGDMLNLVVNGLRAGYSTLQAMEAVSKEMPAPISDEFYRVVQEIQLGLSMEEALDHLIRRIDSEDLDLVITAITIQREVGGNLAEILDVISFTIRERVRIKGEIAALTAQGRATAWVISALPIALSLILYLVNRPYMMQFLNPETRNCGIPILLLAGIMVVSGFAITQKIVKIDI
ncbi:MAG: type II secretion system F family protein [Anaerolineales bacterium]|nr:type II secretion system F family protein [Anaerolineales bacterium]